MKKKDFKIIFMGTPDFAVESLKKLISEGYYIAAVVTNPDKPAGRGRKLKESAVKEYAVSQNLPIIQPEDIKSDNFKHKLEEIAPHLQIVVAFKILPPEIFTIPGYGTFNLHASLLPQYRGAAPINHVIINGEKETGVTTFLLDNKIDTGKIIDQKKVTISEKDNAGSLHDKLMHSGAELVVETTEALRTNNYSLTRQEDLMKPNQPLKKAPKIFKEDCLINWYLKGRKIYDFIRGLSPYPASWTEITDKTKNITLKIYQAKYEEARHSHLPGTIFSDDHSYVKIAVPDGFIHLKEIQVAGKKSMRIEEFLRGFKGINQFKCKTTD